jgi:hypothetical protein
MFGKNNVNFPDAWMETVFCFLCFHQQRLLYRLMDFEIKSSVETFRQTTSESRDDQTCGVKVCFTKKTQKQLPVGHNAVGSESPYFLCPYK